MTKGTTCMETPRVLQIPAAQIQPNPAQPRRSFDPAGLQELAASIVQYGILQPLTVRRRGSGYELVAGERRLRAAQLAGLTEVPCIVLSLDGEQSGLAALVENLQRRDLDCFEEAEALSRLMRLYGLSQEQAAMRIGKSQSAVANKLRLLRHTPRVIESLRANGLSERHARALLRLPSEQEWLDAITAIVNRGLNVARTEQYIEHLLEVRQAARTPRESGLRDVNVFLHTLDRNLAFIRSAGIEADSTRSDTEREIVLTIRIPKRTA